MSAIEPKYRGIRDDRNAVVGTPIYARVTFIGGNTPRQRFPKVQYRPTVPSFTPDSARPLLVLEAFFQAQTKVEKKFKYIANCRTKPNHM